MGASSHRTFNGGSVRYTESFNVVPLVDRKRMVSEAAYFLAEKRGFLSGHDLDDWLQAERQIDAQLSYPARA